jgi:hypothetical protein
MLRENVKLALLAVIAVALSVLAASQIFYYGHFGEQGTLFVRINRITGTFQFHEFYDTRERGWWSWKDRRNNKAGGPQGNPTNNPFNDLIPDK